jgi:hypothetical protein
MQGNRLKSAMNRRSVPFPFPCLRTNVHNKGPGRNKFSGKSFMPVRNDGKT